jgi:hypothetical protein
MRRMVAHQGFDFISQRTQDAPRTVRTVLVNLRRARMPPMLMQS